MKAAARPDKPTLTIRLVRLPDIDSPTAAAEHGLCRYGRFALLRNNVFWFAAERSSHPPTTQTGWYWAVNPAGDLLVSARGSIPDGPALFDQQAAVLAQLVEQLVRERVIRKPGAIVKHY